MDIFKFFKSSSKFLPLVLLTFVSLASCAYDSSDYGTYGGGDYYLYNPYAPNQRPNYDNIYNSGSTRANRTTHFYGQRPPNKNKPTKKKSVKKPKEFSHRSLSKKDSVSYWDDSGASGSPRIVIDLGQQRAKFYKGGKLVGVSRISTGREGFNTPPGSFKIIQKNRNHRSNLYGDYVKGGSVVKRDVDVRKDKRPSGSTFRGASMPYFMRVHGGVGMHAGYLPGYPASHGCIRMPDRLARNFYQNAPLGTPVKIVY